MIRRPPRTTLFPYTTRFRSVTAPSAPRAATAPVPARRRSRESVTATSNAPDTRTAPRSEEHTSELQSRQYLVCRLLLEKKLHCTTPPSPAALPLVCHSLVTK